MKILFLDQTGKLAGAERVLLDIAFPYKEESLVALFEDGPFREALEDLDIPVKVLAYRPINVRRESSLLRAAGSITMLLPLIHSVTTLAKQHELIYVNTPKSLVVGAIASLLSNRPLVYHLHDILTAEHFSYTNRSLMIALANRFAVRVIAVSEAAKNAFIAAGGDPSSIEVIYNGFDASKFCGHEAAGQKLRQNLQLEAKFIVGHFSRLSPWKGQHVLIEALSHCPEKVHALIVGDALFGEDDYVQELRYKVDSMNLSHRIHFLGFRNDIPQLMAACDVIAHTSTAPEPCSRVLIEAMLSGKPLVASKDGGTIELIEDRQTGWLVTPRDSKDLANVINFLAETPGVRNQVSEKAQNVASRRFTLPTARHEVNEVIEKAILEYSSPS